MLPAQQPNADARFNRPAKRDATYQDVVDAPEGMTAEIIHGDLYLQPRPGNAHVVASAELYALLRDPFRRGLGGPGGWLFLVEPEWRAASDAPIKARSDQRPVYVPDIAGWRSNRSREMDLTASHVWLRPDWICEILSSSTEQKDRDTKMPHYARAGVEHIWLLDPRPGRLMLEVFRLEEPTYRFVGKLGPDDPLRAEPFEQIELLPALRDLWQLT